MTSPDPTRLAHAAAAVGTDRPQLALTLANSSLSPSEMHVVGGFTNAMSLAASNRLAIDSGATTNFNAQELNHLDSVNEQAANQPEQKTDDHRSFLEKAADAVGGALSDTGNFLIHNDVSTFIEGALEKVGDAAHLPFRMLSSGLDQGNDAEVDREMKAAGYDPNSAKSYIAFMFNHGESLYHNLDDLRDQFDSKGAVDWQGNKLSYVDLAVQQQMDPEGFQKALEDMDPTAAASLTKTLNSKDYQNVYSQVDQQHISPGRDIARIVTLGHTNNVAFHALSGALDGAYDWFADPTLILGKVSAGIRAADALGRLAEDASLADKAISKVASMPGFRNMRGGIAGIQDQAGVDALLKTTRDAEGNEVAATQIGKGWQGFLSQAKALREADEAHRTASAAGDLETASSHAADRAAIYANMSKRYGSLMAVLPEINGMRVPALHAQFVSGDLERAELLAKAQTDARASSMAGMSEREKLQWGVDNGHTTQAEIDAADPEGVTAIQNKLATIHANGAEGDTAVATMAPPETATFDGVSNTTTGAVETTKAAPIETLEDLRTYLVSRNGLLRINSGWAAQEKLVMPGRLSFWAELRAAGADRFHLDAGSRQKRWLDYTQSHKILPDEVESEGLAAMDTASLTDLDARAKAGDEYFNFLKKGSVDGEGTRVNPLNAWRSSRARAERVNRRLTSMLPQFDHIDLEAAESTKTVEQFARLYMSKGDASVAASAYAMGNIAERRQIVKGILQQSFHASGLSRSAAGKHMMEDYLGDQAKLARQKYGMGDTSQVLTDSGPRQVALYSSQLATKVHIPSFREMNYLAAKYAVGGFASKTGIASIRSSAQAEWMDAVMGRIKLGWITSAAGGFRNALDELAGFAARGLGPDIVKSRVLFSDVTKKMREERRDLSHEWQDEWVAKYGRKAAQDKLGYQVGSAIKSHEDAKLALERAQRDHEANLLKYDEDHPELAASAGALDEAAQDVTDAAAELKHARGLENAIQYRVPLALRGLADHTNDVLLTPLLGHLMSVRAHLPGGKKWAITEDDIKYASELTNLELTRTLRDGVFQTHYADDASLIASDHGAMDLHRSGLQARRYAYGAKFDGWGEVEADGGAGLDSWAKWMQLRFADPTSPAHTWAQTFLHTNGNAVAARDAVRAYMDEDAMRHFVDSAEITNTLRTGQKATTPELRAQALDEYADRVSGDLLQGLARRPSSLPAGMADAEEAIKHAEMSAKATARHDAALERLNALPDRHIIERDKAERQLNWSNKQLAKVQEKHGAGELTDEELLAAHEHQIGRQKRLDDMVTRHTQHQVNAETRYENAKADLENLQGRVVRPTSGEVVTGEHGIHQDLLYQLAHANEIGVPDRAWLAQNVPAEARPTHTIGQLWAPYNAKHELGEMPSGYTPMLSQAYNKVVTDQINALSRNPLMTHLYVTARKNTEPYEKELLAHGFTPEAAKSITQKMSLSHAETEAFKMIDNPYVASQFSTIARNIWAFERAQEDWLRRWGRTIRDNPQIIRQAQLLIHGGTSTGLVEKDDQGNLTFVYPGSGLAISVFNKAFSALGLSDVVQIPVTGELTSQLTFLNPSLDNPIGFSGTPLVSLPLKAISSTLGAHHPILMAGLDKAVNGDLGAGRKWYETMLPSSVNRILGGVLSEDPASKFGAAYTQALFNMDAAGRLDAYRNGDASAKARLQDELATQVHNNLFATAIFGFFAPAAPTIDYKVDPNKGDTVDGDAENSFRGNKADWSAHVTGLKSLKDEYRAMAARVGVEKANAWWAAVHPNELIYQQGGAGSRTVVGTTSAQAPATLRAAEWMQSNPDFIKAYGGKGGVASYFLPGTPGHYEPDGKGGQTFVPDPGAAGGKDDEYSDVAYRAQLETGMREYKSLDEVFDDIVVARGEQIYYNAKDKYDTLISQAEAAGDHITVKSLEDEWSAKKQEIYAGNPLLEQKNVSYATNSAQQKTAMAQLDKLIGDQSPQVAAAIGANRDGLIELRQAFQSYQDGAAQLSGRRGAYAAGQRAGLKDSYASTVTSVQARYPELADVIRGVFRIPN
jgi:hypothetical protein